ncbi:MAG TPA: hypothetical protein VES20_12635 [Bryobacteraceae bacterium]|nr:hypothetical protein [Bryobacteraceae bacterium]
MQRGEAEEPALIENTRNANLAAAGTLSLPNRTTTTGTGFEQQLSQALSESLSKLGVTPGTVNISISNGSGASAARQILITWNASASGAAPAASTPAPVPTAGNPFLPPEMRTPAAPDNSRQAATAEADPSLPKFALACDTPWCSYTGPKDRRDQIAPGGGARMASGAPKIELCKVPAGNQWNYTGLAAYNPYFTTPSNPLRPGYVLGFENWFTGAMITGGKNGAVPANKLYYATEEGAQEALRLVQQYDADATVGQFTFAGGPFSATSPMYYINFPDGRQMNAGLILAGYYNHGYGVSTASDSDLARSLRSV